MTAALVMVILLATGTLLVGTFSIFANLVSGYDRAALSLGKLVGPAMPSNRNNKIHKPREVWQAELSAKQYEVTRCRGTEPPFTGQYVNHEEEGIYYCVCCDNQLFSWKAKFDPGCGWPSYWQPINQDAVTEMNEISYGQVRLEIQCSQCEAHLGHVFDDGPEPTGKRYCINSASLGFIGVENQE